MKKLSLMALMLFSFGIMLTLQSCQDECKDVECQNGGICTEGICDCATGYEGDLCETEERAKFLGTYSASENCDTENEDHTVTISESSSEVTKIIINNLYGAGIATTGTVSGSSVTIASQTFGNGTIEGDGSISGSSLSLSYTITVGGASDNCSISGNKQ